MKVLVFDVDGTLTRTNEVDGELFRAAVRAVLPERAVTSFRQFPELTDAAILRAICSDLDEGEYEVVEKEVRRHFLHGLEVARASLPHAFVPVPGAREIFAEVRRGGWIPAIATGGWRESAELKLAAALIPTRGIPLATSTERVRRVDIIRLAVDEAVGKADAADIVYVGDGVWDLRACRELGIGFVGRAAPGTSDRLTQEGARAVIEDFGHPGGLLDLLADPEDLRPL